MKENRKKRYLLLFCISIMITACGKQPEVYLESYITSESDKIEADKDMSLETDETEVFDVADVDKTMATLASDTEIETFVYVYVCGAVISPGVYALSEGSRICDAIDMAGGLREDADVLSVNLAELLCDGQMLRIYTYEEILAGVGKEVINSSTDSEGMKNQTFSDNETDSININTATKGQLMTLPGIGNAKAEAIIAYRTQHGAFESVDALMQIPGIKEGILEQIRNYIRID